MLLSETKELLENHPLDSSKIAIMDKEMLEHIKSQRMNNLKRKEKRFN